MAANSHNCFVIHSKPFSDSRLILQLLTPEFGVVSGLYRLPSKKYTFRPKPFEPLLVFFHGKSQLKTITSLEPTDTAFHLTGERLFCGLYLNELIERLLRIQESCHTIFEVYRNILACLYDQDNYVASLRVFELHLLVHLGYAPDYEYDTYGDKIENSDTVFYLYEPDIGFKRLIQPRNAVNTFTGKTLYILNTLNIDQISENPNIKRFTRLALKPLLGPKPLKARSLFS